MDLKKLFDNRLLMQGLYLLITCIFMIPFLLSNGALYGFDLFFHIDRMMGLSNVHSSPINFTTFFNVGQGVNLFYPWLTLYPLFIVYKLVHSIYWAFILYLFGLTYLTVVLSYHSAKSIANSKKVGLLFAFLYVFSAYRVDNILSRFALGEIISFTFLPLVFWGLFEIIKGNYRKWYLLAIGMSLIAYSHILSVILSSFVILLIVLASIWGWDNKYHRILGLLKATTLTLLSTSFIWVGILQQYFYLSIESPQKIEWGKYAKNITDIAQSSLNNDLSSHMMGLVVFMGLLFILTNFNRLTNEQRFYSGCSLLLLFLITDLFPETIIKWLHLEVVQYPYRFTIYLSILILFVVSQWMIKATNKMMWVMILSIILLHLGTVSRQIDFLSHKVNFVPARELSKRNDVYSLTHSFKQYDYANKVNQSSSTISKNRELLFNHRVLVNGEIVKSDVLFSKSNVTFTFKTSMKNSKVILPLYYYIGQFIKSKGDYLSSKVSSRGSTEVTLPKSGEQKIIVGYQYTKTQMASACLSLIACLYAAYLAVLGKRR